MIDANVLEGRIKKISWEEMAIAGKAMKLGNAAGPSEVCAMISASGKVGIAVVLELCQRVFDGKGMKDEW